MEFSYRRSGDNGCCQISEEEEGVVTLLGACGEDGGRMHGMQEDEVMHDHDFCGLSWWGCEYRLRGVRRLTAKQAS